MTFDCTYSLLCFIRNKYMAWVWMKQLIAQLTDLPYPLWFLLPIWLSCSWSITCVHRLRAIREVPHRHFQQDQKDWDICQPAEQSSCLGRDRKTFRSALSVTINFTFSYCQNIVVGSGRGVEVDCKKKTFIHFKHTSFVYNFNSFRYACCSSLQWNGNLRNEKKIQWNYKRC